MVQTETLSQCGHPLKEKDLAWLQRLQEAIWSFPPPSTIRLCATVKRKLTLREYKRIVALVQTYGLPCELLATGPINGFTLAIYNNATCPGVAPEHIINLDDGHFYLNDKSKNLWHRTLKAYMRLANTPENAKRAEFYGLQTPKQLDHYKY